MFDKAKHYSSTLVSQFKISICNIRLPENLGFLRKANWLTVSRCANDVTSFF